MNLMANAVVAIQILAALAMIGLVLVQHGKGADMGASFGSGASGSLFGATGSANFLSRSTAVCAAIFFSCTLFLAYLSNDRSRVAATSVLDRPAISAPAAATAASSASAAAVIGGAASATNVEQIPSASVGASAAAAVSTAVPTSLPATAASGAATIPSNIPSK